MSAIVKDIIYIVNTFVLYIICHPDFCLNGTTWEAVNLLSSSISAHEALTIHDPKKAYQEVILPREAASQNHPTPWSVRAKVKESEKGVVQENIKVVNS